MKLLIGTRNRNKFREIRASLRTLRLEVVCADDLPDAPNVAEDSVSFRDNAIRKATTLARATGLLTLGDDSGLQVEALDGRPGVLSSRYAGPEATDKENIEKLLAELKNVPDEQRRARFVCSVAVATPNGLIGVAEGVCEGTITQEERGTEGFGYDPVFLKREYGKTFGELGPDIKNRISHRALALQKALLILENYLITREGRIEAPVGAPEPGPE